MRSTAAGIDADGGLSSVGEQRDQDDDRQRNAKQQQQK
ncbi:MAG: hypothetical protein JWP52_27 [Rhizobacter sp.]|nr:hypothetical protein [Rhizobacter sp.]